MAILSQTSAHGHPDQSNRGPNDELPWDDVFLFSDNRSPHAAGHAQSDIWCKMQIGGIVKILSMSTQRMQFQWKPINMWSPIKLWSFQHTSWSGQFIKSMAALVVFNFIKFVFLYVFVFVPVLVFVFLTCKRVRWVAQVNDSSITIFYRCVCTGKQNTGVAQSDLPVNNACKGAVSP